MHQLNVGNGLMGYCGDCNRPFIQGGRLEIARNRAVLERRVELATYDKDLREEILQDALMRILRGDGNCNTIELRTSQNRQMMYGRFNQLGSDSTAMRMLNGQPPLKE